MWHKQKARTHTQIRSMDLHLVYSVKHQFCILSDYYLAGANCQRTNKQNIMEARFDFDFFLVLQS